MSPPHGLAGPLVAALGLLCSCASSHQRFQPTADVHSESPQGHPAASYEIVAPRRVGEVRVWSRGAWDQKEGEDTLTRVHLGLEVENVSDEPLALDRGSVRLHGLLPRDRPVEGLAPERRFAELLVHPASTASAEFTFRPEDVRAADIESFEARWQIRLPSGRTDQRAPLRHERLAPADFDARRNALGIDALVGFRAFAPEAETDRKSPQGLPAASYPIRAGRQHRGTVRVWSRGAWEVHDDRGSSTVIHLGMEIENTADMPLSIERSAVRLSAVAGGERFLQNVLGSGWAPDEPRGELTVDPGRVAVADFWFEPEGLDPDRIEVFQAHWAVRMGDGTTLGKRTSFRASEEPPSRWWGWWGGYRRYWSCW